MKRPLAILAAATMAAVSLWVPARAAGSAPSWGSHPGSALQPFGRPIALSGSSLAWLPSAHRLGAVPGSRQLSVVVTLRARDRAGLDALVHEQYTAGSALYHHWITPAQFAARFAPTPAQRRQIESWLRSQGLRVTGAAKNGLEIDATGTVARVQRAFHTDLATYRGRGMTFFTNSRLVQVPEGLAGQIQDVAGLDNLAQVARVRDAHPRPLAKWQHFDSSLDPMQPADLKDWYNIQKLADAGLHGEGQTIGVFQFSDFNPANIAAFDQKMGLPAATIQRVGVDGTPKITDQDTEGECELDLEILHAFAPAATIIMYESNDGSFASWIKVWNKIVSDDKAPVVSMSYGLPETDWHQSDVVAMNTVLEQAAAQGQGAFASTGDHGAYDVRRKDHQGDPNWDKLIAHFPSTSPWVTSVGGTMLQANSDNTLSELGWSETADKPVDQSGGGGGLSIWNKEPWYQVGAGVNNQYSNGMRQTPDVSALSGDPGYLYYTAAQNDSGDWENTWVAGFGTSAATPFWAAYATLVNQALGKPVGFLNPSIYQLAQKASTFQYPPFFDITQGDNLYYPATPGWDYATGWGPMDGVAFLNDLHAMGPLTVHPVGFHFTIWVVGKKKGGKWPILTTIKRNQKVNILDHTTYEALPVEDVTGTVEYTVSQGTYTALHHLTQVSVQHSQLGHTVEHHLSFKLPASAPKGVYTVTVKIVLGPLNWSGTATLQVNVR